MQVPMTDDALYSALERLRDRVTTAAEPILVRFGGDASDPSQMNLASYLALRHIDVRPLQRELAWRGLSSLGRLESRVLPTIDATLTALARLIGRNAPLPVVTRDQFYAGEHLLESRTDGLFGAARETRRTRIMVTLSPEAASDRSFVSGLMAAGMDIARINCAHDDDAAWRSMAANVREVAAKAGRTIPILFDIGGPKVRTAQVSQDVQSATVQTGGTFWLVAAPMHLGHAPSPAATISLAGIIERLKVGDRVGYNDGRLQGIVEAVGDGEALVRVVSTKAEGTRLKPEKGLNFPDTDLGLSPLTDQDRIDLHTVAECGDLVGYSFVTEPGDIDLLQAALAETGSPRKLGLILKLEHPRSVANLPRLIARASARGPFGVMIARGDLAAELGFERLAEIQEEILWIAEAASVPVIWATQVLDELARTGVPSRGEMTDAAMSARAECVMLNKGPAVTAAIETLDRLLGRMDEHLKKKTPTLRPLRSW